MSRSRGDRVRAVQARRNETRETHVDKIRFRRNNVNSEAKLQKSRTQPMLIRDILLPYPRVLQILNLRYSKFSEKFSK
jgi:hypothetical protein